MKKIESFTVDHLKLQKGLYVSRIDQVGEEILTTFDLRMKLPNREKLSNEAIHTLEHLIATYTRNDEKYGHKVIYFGPMGCLTGMYFILHGKYNPLDILPFLRSAFEFVSNYNGEIPGVSKIECGNYKLHNLVEAKKEAKDYLEVLNNANENNLIYPI